MMIEPKEHFLYVMEDEALLVRHNNVLYVFINAGWSREKKMQIVRKYGRYVVLGIMDNLDGSFEDLTRQDVITMSKVLEERNNERT